MTNIVNITFIRHAYSLANEYRSVHKKSAIDPLYADAKLSKKGFEQLENFDLLEDTIISYDYVLVSPLKRAIQTCLSILPENFDKPVYICPLVSEIGNCIENKVSSKDDVFNDTDITRLPNFEKLIYTIDLPYDDPMYCGIGSNESNRIHLFKNFLRRETFANKKLLIVCHYNFIKKLTGNRLDNLEFCQYTF